MNTQSIIKSALFAASFSAMALIGSAQAQVINLNVNINGGGNGGAYSGQGAYSDPGNNLWNAFNITNQAVGGETANPSQTESSLLTSTGASSTVSFTVSAPAFVDAYDASGNPPAGAPKLLSDFIYGYGADPVDFTIGGLTAGHTYDLFLYSQNAGYDSGSGTFTIGSSVKTAVNTGAANSAFIQGNNYVEFTGLTGASISGTVDTSLTPGSYLNGFQLVDVTPAAPEPSTYALMGLGALALLVISRRRRTV